MHRATHRLPGLLLTDHEFQVPLDHKSPAGAQITLFAREAVAPRKRDQGLPWIVFLQGGPGGLSPRPRGRSGWLGRALQDHRVLLLDQRGTGRSTPQTRQTLAALPDAAAQARQLTHFRADSIVRDAELVRAALLGDEKWLRVPDLPLARAAGAARRHPHRGPPATGPRARRRLPRDVRARRLAPAALRRSLSRGPGHAGLHRRPRRPGRRTAALG
jgi:pimeloyl-ACP methyl ester carboxylesterase